MLTLIYAVSSGWRFFDGGMQLTGFWGGVLATLIAIGTALALCPCPIGMLVLSRQRDESIIIGDNIVITVVDIRGDKVRLGIQAPTEIPVHRQEVYEAIQRENRQAARLDPQDARQLEHLNPPLRRDVRRPRTEGI